MRYTIRDDFHSSGLMLRISKRLNRKTIWLSRYRSLVGPLDRANLRHPNFENEEMLELDSQNAKSNMVLISTRNPGFLFWAEYQWLCDDVVVPLLVAYAP